MFGQRMNYVRTHQLGEWKQICEQHLINSLEHSSPEAELLFYFRAFKNSQYVEKFDSKIKK